MLALMCKAAQYRYAINAHDVLEVVPRVHLRTMPGVPDWMAGMCVYRGRILPVLDLASLAANVATPNQWSSRIVLVREASNGEPLTFGIVVEQVAVAQILQEKSVACSGMGTWGTLHLDDEGMFQRLDLSRLLTPDRRAILNPSSNPEPNGRNHG